MNKYTITSIMILLSSSSLAQDSCMVRPSCADMGYTKSATDCEGKKAISCPFDTTLFYCPESGFSEYPLETCPDNGVCSELTQYKLDSCQNSYELSSDGLTCNACNFTNYPLSSCDANGTCSDYTCGNVTKYKLDSCNSGYTQSGNTCTANCNFTNYPLSSCPSNGNCSNYECGGTTKYKLNSCKSGYNKSGNTCVYACSGYYECGGDWQYCEGYVCSADSSMCSEYCEDDYFPYSCDSEELCDDAWGVYRDGYCSEECEEDSGSSGGSSSGGSSDDCSACIDMSTCSDGGSLNADCDCFEYCCDDFMEWWRNGGYPNDYCNGNYDEDEFQKCWWDVGPLGRGPDPLC
ncbi:MAG: hypothetical protein E7012_05620 [Alphaproteobacteria bacterium]|nr:hypothetical protein [Alphaproteobacteria bacterium]